MIAAQAVGGFVLGAIVSFLMPPIALALALILVGVLLWQRFRAETVEGLGAPASGFLAAVTAYVLVAVVSSL
ncbi:MAG: hypothetical protein ABIO16_11265 [Nocardioides sp.]